MSKIKSLILGSAAVLAASAGAQAADLPVKAKAVQYVKICSLYGAGFYYIPGTDTCIKLGGYTQLDVNFNGGNYDQPPWTAASGTDVAGRPGDMYTTRARNQFNIDTRTATEYGVVRTFWASNFEFSTGATFNASTGNLTVDYGFIQFAGFTLGKAVGTFQTPWGAYGANNNTSYLLGGYDNATGITQIAYTWQFGNGVSAQVGVEDSRTIDRGFMFNGSNSGVTTATMLTSAYTNNYGGNSAPDLAANVKIDQAAFTLQFSGAAHANHAAYYGTTEPSGHPSDKYGYAASVGLQLKNLPTGPGDKLSLDGTWSKGGIKYLISGVTGTATAQGMNFTNFGGAAFAGSYQSFATVLAADSVYTGGGNLELTTAWGFRGAYVHNWSPNWETDLFGSYTRVDYNANATAIICGVQAAAVGATAANGYSCNPDFNIWQIGTRTAWTPVQNLTFSAEVMYTFLDQSNTGSFTSAGAGVKPAAVYDYKDQGMWSGNIRVRRTW
ncbi:MAG: porin [Afipia sp.]|nr:porin [Afipia sp.]